MVFALVLVGCGQGAEPEAEDEALLRLCERTCLKPLCDGAIDPGPEAGAMCRAICEAELEEVSREGCVEAYSALHECLDALSCEPFYAWLEGSTELADLPCGAEELALEQACPGVDLRAR